MGSLAILKEQFQKEMKSTANSLHPEWHDRFYQSNFAELPVEFIPKSGFVIRIKDLANASLQTNEDETRQVLLNTSLSEISESNLKIAAAVLQTKTTDWWSLCRLVPDDYLDSQTDVDYFCILQFIRRELRNLRSPKDIFDRVIAVLSVCHPEYDHKQKEEIKKNTCFLLALEEWGMVGQPFHILQAVDQAVQESNERIINERMYIVEAGYPFTSNRCTLASSQPNIEEIALVLFRKCARYSYTLKEIATPKFEDCDPLMRIAIYSLSAKLHQQQGPNPLHQLLQGVSWSSTNVPVLPDRETIWKINQRINQYVEDQEKIATDRISHLSSLFNTPQDQEMEIAPVMGDLVEEAINNLEAEGNEVQVTDGTPGAIVFQILTTANIGNDDEQDQNQVPALENAAGSSQFVQTSTIEFSGQHYLVVADEDVSNATGPSQVVVVRQRILPEELTDEQKNNCRNAFDSGIKLVDKAKAAADILFQETSLFSNLERPVFLNKRKSKKNKLTTEQVEAREIVKQKVEDVIGIIKSLLPTCNEVEGDVIDGAVKTLWTNRSNHFKQ